MPVSPNYPRLLGHRTKRLYEPVRELGRGTNAVVLADDRGNAFKLFNEPITDQTRWKLEAIVNVRNKLPGWACPHELVADYHQPDRTLGVRCDAVPGTNLADLLDRQQSALVNGQTDGLLAVESKIRILLSMLRGLMAARALTGLAFIPTDWNPANVIVAPDNQSATAIDVDGNHWSGFRVFPDGTPGHDPGPKGTPGYRAPERLDGLAPQSPSWDWLAWAFGAVAFELLYGFHVAKPRSCPEAGRLSADERVRRRLYVRYMDPHPVFRPPPYAKVDVPDAVETLIRASIGPAHDRPDFCDWEAGLNRWLWDLCGEPYWTRVRKQVVEAVREFRANAPDLSFLTRPLCVGVVLYASVKIWLWADHENREYERLHRHDSLPAHMAPAAPADPPVPETPVGQPIPGVLYGGR